MARCPECGSWVWFPPGWFEEHVCSNCGAILKLKASLGGLFLGSLEVVGFASTYRRTHPFRNPSRMAEEDVPQGLRGDLGEATARHIEEDGEEETSDKTETPSMEKDSSNYCQYCGAVVTPSDARFCANCGASLSYGLKGAPRKETESEVGPENYSGEVSEHEENCIVCSLRLTSEDNVVWCPHCGGLAHRTHMRDWVRAKKCCPTCDRPLGEDYYE